MRSLSPVARHRAEMQGFVGLDDEHLAEINSWLRLSPGICLAWVAAATVTASPVLMLALVPFAAGGAVLRNHPFDVIYNHGLRHLLGTRPLPRYGAPRRFACAVGSLWMTAAGTALAAGFTTLGLVLGVAMVALASVQVLTGFCVPSFIYQLGRERRRPRPLTA
ncbi:MAG TPA: DUF4395 family protein [Thermoanaerobaculales bacterium]|nr:DUF4395 family protein [Thermoanaerobaculales bacterium]